MSNQLGCPTKYKEEYCQQLIDYFNRPLIQLKKTKIASGGKVVEVEVEEPCDLPMFNMFALEIGVCRDTLHEWTKKHPNFSDAYKTANEIQKEIIQLHALKNNYNPTFCMFMLKCNHGFKDNHGITIETQKAEINYLKREE